ncbi:SDR family NAD(P)-dependent oxidoreductase [Nocardiopsis tropica]|uniref:SDR family NAD(P)-dependent oxidoreductase n=1 Tax=Tsukamurella strandjordii TaxID=147577 RepID=UPI0031D19F69
MPQPRSGGDRSDTAVVTGASRGIGLAVAHRLARSGHHVVLTSRRLEDAQTAADRVCAAVGDDAAATGAALELGDRDSIAEFATPLARDGGLRVLVNNAGIAPTSTEYTKEGFERHTAVNVLGSVLLTETLLPRLAVNGRAGLFGISSLSNVVATRSRIRRSLTPGDLPRPVPFLHYAASKAALHLVLRHYRRRAEQQSLDLTVGSIYPGFVDTSIYDEYSLAVRRAIRLAAVSPDRSGEVVAAMLADGPRGEFYRGAQWPLLQSPVTRSDDFAAHVHALACDALGIESAWAAEVAGTGAALGKD